MMSAWPLLGQGQHSLAFATTPDENNEGLILSPLRLRPGLLTLSARTLSNHGRVNSNLVPPDTRPMNDGQRARQSFDQC